MSFGAFPKFNTDSPTRLPQSERVNRKPSEDLLCSLGVTTENIRPDIGTRLALLDQKTKTVEDEKMALEEAQLFFRFREEQGHPLDPSIQKTIQLATLLADIGKTGPREASPQAQEIITSIYAVENIPDISITLDTFLTQHFPHHAIEYKKELSALHIEPSLTLAQFYRLHTNWTFDILQGSNLPPDAILAAASHHLLEGDNPQQILDVTTGQFKLLDHTRELDERDIFVMLFDKYDAVRRRGHGDHVQAISYLKKRVESNSSISSLPTKYKTLFLTAIDDVDRALKTQQLPYAQAA